jgi:hypothetical protein
MRICQAKKIWVHTGCRLCQKMAAQLQQMVMVIHQVRHARDLFCAWVVFKALAFVVFHDLPLRVI